MSIPDTDPQVESQIAVAARNYGLKFGYSEEAYTRYRQLYLDVRSPNRSLLAEPRVERFTYREEHDAMTVYDVLRQCTGKQPYANRREAATAQKRRDNHPGALPGVGRVKPYACPHCGMFHLGHQPIKRR